MYCEHCGFRIESGEECEQCRDLDFRYVPESEQPIDVGEIRWAEDGGYVIATTRWWSRSEYIAIEDPDDVDSVFEKRDGAAPSGFLGLFDLFRRR